LELAISRCPVTSRGFDLAIGLGRETGDDSELAISFDPVTSDGSELAIGSYENVAMVLSLRLVSGFLHVMNLIRGSALAEPLVRVLACDQFGLVACDGLELAIKSQR
jgi:hypothetical protein